MTIKCCVCHGKVEGTRAFGIYGKYGFCGFMHKPSFANFDQPSSLELRVALGKEIVSKLPNKMKRENNGRFIAITLKSGKVIAICDSIESLNKQIRTQQIRENYYIERLGYSTFAEF